MSITRPRLRFPSSALILSCLALFAALGGTTYAATSSGSSPPVLHKVGAPGQPPFQNGWHNYGFGGARAAFYKDSAGIVHLQGTITGATSFPSTVFKLPSGFRPAKTQEFAALTVNTGPTRVINQLEVQPGGDVVLYDPVGLWASLSGITFHAGL